MPKSKRSTKPVGDEAKPQGKGYSLPTDKTPLDGLARKHGYQNYDDYLRSDHWRLLRARFLQNRSHSCACGAPGIQLHHLTYKRLGQENLEDLEFVCIACHKDKHKRAKNVKTITINAEPRPRNKKKSRKTTRKLKQHKFHEQAEWIRECFKERRKGLYSTEKIMELTGLGSSETKSAMLHLMSYDNRFDRWSEYWTFKQLIR